MSGLPPTFSTAPGFLGVTRHDTGASICVAGIPLDLGTTNRAGARFGPHGIRHASRMLVDGDHPSNWLDPAELSLSDIGNFQIKLGDLPGSLALIEEQAAKIGHLVALGGEHSLTLPLLRALWKRIGPVGLIHFDAHMDTWPDSFGQTYGHGSVFYHAIKEGLILPEHMVQIGIRSPITRAIHDWTIEKGVTVIRSETVHESSPAIVAERIRSIIGAQPCYLSFDIDALDPAFAPGTGTPEIGGLATWQAQGILRRLRGLNFVGMDVVEVAPDYDRSEITALAGATFAWEYITALAGTAA